MKKKKIWKSIILLFVLAFIGLNMSMCVNQSTWSSEERLLITEASDSKMKLYTINNKQDSLFLRRQCLPLSKENINDTLFSQLKKRMLLTVTDPDHEGVGIAAPQVGISRRLISVQRMDKEGEPFEFYINPQLVYLSPEKNNGWEGCLSVPNARGEVPRSTCVVVEYRNLIDFSLQRDTVKGFTAIIFQHETDHLNGTLYLDKAITIK